MFYINKDRAKCRVCSVAVRAEKYAMDAHLDSDYHAHALLLANLTSDSSTEVPPDTEPERDNDELATTSDNDSDTLSNIGCSSTTDSTGATSERGWISDLDSDIDFDEEELDDLHTDTDDDSDSDRDEFEFEDYGVPFGGREAGEGDPYYPFPDRPAFMFSLISNIPRIPLSDKFLNYLRWWCAQLGVFLPPLSMVREIEKKLFPQVYPDPIHGRGTVCKSPFYHNSIIATIKNELANPYVRKHLVTLPEDSGTQISNFHQAHRWREDPDMQAPMITLPGGLQIYRNEFARIRGGRVIFLERFLMINGTLSIQYRPLRQHLGALWIHEDQLLSRRATDVEGCVHMLPYTPQAVAERPGLCYLAGGTEDNVNKQYTVERLARLCSAHPIRGKAAGRNVVNVILVMFSDDMSGNRSKRWNKYESWYFTLAGLPSEESNKEYNMHFVATSNNVPGIEMLPGFIGEITNVLAEGFVAYDDLSKREIYVVGSVLCWLADNPMAAVYCSSIGPCGLHPCRECKVCRFDGTAESLRQYMQIGERRSTEGTVQTLRQQFQMAGFWGNKGRVQQLQKDSGVKCAISEHYIQDLFRFAKGRPSRQQVEAWFHDIGDLNKLYNPLLLHKSLDPHTTSPVEVLHTFLLGPVLYLFKYAINHLSDIDKKTLSIRLDCFSAVCLPRRCNGHQFTRYLGSMVGKDFKAISQAAPFVFHGLLDPEDKWDNIWKRVAIAARLIFLCDIDIVDEYCEDLHAALQQLILAVANVNLAFLSKPKFHYLLHLPEHVKRFGPPLFYATEKFESFNSQTRGQAYFTNRQAPSRDISTASAKCAALRHILSGGTWMNEGGRRVCAGRDIREMFGKDQELQQVWGYTRSSTTYPSTRLWSKIAETTVFQTRTGVAAGWPREVLSTPAKLWKKVGSDVGEMCAVGNFVLLKDNRFCRIVEILQAFDSVHLFMDTFTLIDDELHPSGCPKLKKQENQIVVRGNLVRGPVNVQHDCRLHECQPVVASARIEREILPNRREALHHEDDTDFLLNIHCLRTRWVAPFVRPREVVPDLDAAIAAICTAEAEQQFEALNSSSPPPMNSSPPPPPIN